MDGEHKKENKKKEKKTREKGTIDIYCTKNFFVFRMIVCVSLTVFFIIIDWQQRHDSPFCM